jgi:hypothetical protein|tara:strand:- start:1029 stop:1181 length:153 start_codon:yes stop_codon:yes gene_type:complete
MTSYNDITGDALVSKSNTKNFRDNYDKIFSSPKKGKKEKSSNERKLNRIP